MVVKEMRGRIEEKHKGEKLRMRRDKKRRRVHEDGSEGDTKRTKERSKRCKGVFLRNLGRERERSRKKIYGSEGDEGKERTKHKGEN